MATKLTPVVADELEAMDRDRTGPHVYRAIAAVQGELSSVGIAKSRKNTQGSGYMFRGIDDVYSALSPLLAKHHLVVVPRVINREVIERQSRNGGALFYVTVHVEFDFVSALDGSKHTAATFGEAMDSGDKATNKAMSAAYKYAAFMTFAIPTEGDNDTENQTHEVAASDGSDATNPRAVGDMSDSALRGCVKTLVHNLNGCASLNDMDELLGMKETQETIEQCKRRFPNWWSTGAGMPAEFKPLKKIITETRAGLIAIEGDEQREYAGAVLGEERNNR